MDLPEGRSEGLISVPAFRHQIVDLSRTVDGLWKVHL